ncbi:hypothetical protein BASA50_002444 [Batrachochytrium salamandrivorans]|uniref:Uncharacterized protein n=1 Tax=Batrachochytrium salamandrivorans TaxID=1357716 RepID=A0ABQ8FLU4_9FUNG|nr:hypothetical protein BASA50_002444 [Batrachochytrium salamandrivorans]KAJ1342737.1 hypothetical protein BSLG_002834 [Batrachochytrium salamandrivorans]
MSSNFLRQLTLPDFGVTFNVSSSSGETRGADALAAPYVLLGSSMVLVNTPTEHGQIGVRARNEMLIFVGNDCYAGDLKMLEYRIRAVALLSALVVQFGLPLPGVMMRKGRYPHKSVAYDDIFRRQGSLF